MEWMKGMADRRLEGLWMEGKGVVKEDDGCRKQVKGSGKGEMICWQEW